MYRPILPNGEEPELPWQLKFIKLHLCWPLRDDVSCTTQFLHDTWTIILASFFVETIHADWLFIFAYFDNLELLTESLCTTIIGMMMFFRILHLQFNRKRLHRMFVVFFGKVFVSRSENESLFLNSKKALRLMNILAVALLTPLVFFLLTPPVIISINYTETGKPFPYKLEFPYDAQKPVPYAVTVLYTSWVGVAVTTTLIGENTLLSLIFNHLANRITLIQEDIRRIYARSLQATRIGMASGQSAHYYFTSLLRLAIGKQIEMMEFVDDLEKLFSPMSLILLVFSTFLVCTIAFQLALHGVNLSTSRYIFWLCASLLEVHILSKSGQMTIDTSQRMATEFYMCKWEELMEFGTMEENVRLMQIIQIIIARSQKPMRITALKFTTISLATFLKVLNASFSYFMFLNAMRDIK